MDLQIRRLIEEETVRQTRGIELIASENYTSPEVIRAMGSVLTNKYAEGYPGKRYYGGCEVIDKVENLAIERIKKVFGAEYANVQPHSGSQANAAIYLACLKPGDKILGFDLSHGGHLTHGSPVNFSGKYFKTCFYKTNRETGRINYDDLEKTAKEELPKLIICGASSYSRDFDYVRFRKVADKVGAILIADISHPAGLIAKGLLKDPFPHCHIISSTTHKTLRGPRGGIIMMGKDFKNPWNITTKKGSLRPMSALLNSAVFPGIQGGPLEHIIAAKAVSFGQLLTDEFKEYGIQVQKNAKRLASSLIDLGFKIISGGTDNHCILIDLRNKSITGKEAEETLMITDITCNKNMVPYDDQSPFITSGIRIGTAAITTRGLKEEDMEKIAQFIDQTIIQRENKSELDRIRKEINDMMSDYPLFTI